jgi:hypothetical protein
VIASLDIRVNLVTYLTVPPAVSSRVVFALFPTSANAQQIPPRSSTNTLPTSVTGSSRLSAQKTATIMVTALKMDVLATWVGVEMFVMNLFVQAIALVQESVFPQDIANATRLLTGLIAASKDALVTAPTVESVTRMVIANVTKVSMVLIVLVPIAHATAAERTVFVYHHLVFVNVMDILLGRTAPIVQTATEESIVMNRLVLMNVLVMDCVLHLLLAIATRGGPENSARQIIVRTTVPTEAIVLMVPAVVGKVGKGHCALFPFAMEATQHF